MEAHVNRTLIALVALIFCGPILQADQAIDDKRDQLWEVFGTALVEELGKETKIQVYAENAELTKICFIIKGGGLYVFSKSTGKIEKVIHAKKINYSSINRITHEMIQRENGVETSNFKLWGNKSVVLRLGY